METETTGSVLRAPKSHTKLAVPSNEKPSHVGLKRPAKACILHILTSAPAVETRNSYSPATLISPNSTINAATQGAPPLTLHAASPIEHASKRLAQRDDVSVTACLHMGRKRLAVSHLLGRPQPCVPYHPHSVCPGCFGSTLTLDPERHDFCASRVIEQDARKEEASQALSHSSPVVCAGRTTEGKRPFTSVRCEQVVAFLHLAGAHRGVAHRGVATPH